MATVLKNIQAKMNSRAAAAAARSNGDDEYKSEYENDDGEGYDTDDQ